MQSRHALCRGWEAVRLGSSIRSRVQREVWRHSMGLRGSAGVLGAGQAGGMEAELHWAQDRQPSMGCRRVSPTTQSGTASEGRSSTFLWPGFGKE